MAAEAKAQTDTPTEEAPAAPELPASTADATIYQRMHAILAELPAIGKSDWNEQQKFHFRGHDAVLNALNPLLAKHGVVVVPDVLERVADRRETSRGSIMYEVNLHMRFTFYGVAGDSLIASTWGEGTDMGDKATNKAMTMAFKAVLAQAFAVSTQESYDTDGTTAEETVRSGSGGSGGGSGGGSRSTQQARNDVPPAKNWAELFNRLGELGIPSDDAAIWFAQIRGALEIDAETDEGKLAIFTGGNKMLVALTGKGSVANAEDPRVTIRALIKHAFGDKAEVDGPVWAISAKDGERPTKEQLAVATPAETPAAAEPAAEIPVATREPTDDDIPF